MQAHLADKFPDSAATLTSLWRRYQLEYTWRATAQGTYQPFESITRRALLHALAECSEKFNEEDVDDIMSKYETLQMYHHYPPLLYVRISSLDSLGSGLELLSIGSPTSKKRSKNYTTKTPSISYSSPTAPR